MDTKSQNNIEMQRTKSLISDAKSLLQDAQIVSSINSKHILIDEAIKCLDKAVTSSTNAQMLSKKLVVSPIEAQEKLKNILKECGLTDMDDPSYGNPGVSIERIQTSIGNKLTAEAYKACVDACKESLKKSFETIMTSDGTDDNSLEDKKPTDVNETRSTAQVDGQPNDENAKAKASKKSKATKKESKAKKEKASKAKKTTIGEETVDTSDAK